MRIGMDQEKRAVIFVTGPEDGVGNEIALQAREKSAPSAILFVAE